MWFVDAAKLTNFGKLDVIFDTTGPTFPKVSSVNSTLSIASVEVALLVFDRISKTLRWHFSKIPKTGADFHRVWFFWEPGPGADWMHSVVHFASRPDLSKNTSAKCAKFLIFPPRAAINSKSECVSDQLLSVRIFLARSARVEVTSHP
jgi:hypothetical protein